MAFRDHHRFLLPRIFELLRVAQSRTGGGDLKAVRVKRSNRKRNTSSHTVRSWLRRGATGKKHQRDDRRAGGRLRRIKPHGYMNGSATVRSVFVVTRTSFFASASAASLAIFGQSEGFASIFSNSAVVSLLAHSSFFQITFPSRPVKVARAAMIPPSSRPFTGPAP